MFNIGFLPSVVFNAISFTDLLSVLGARVLLSMKEAGEREADGISSHDLGVVSPLEFANNSYYLQEPSAALESWPPG